MEKSDYYVSCTGKLCITFPATCGDPPELCVVEGCFNDTWFIHKEIKP